ncbi:MAG TPA: porin family protein [Bryobacteraceae bacterium]|nr:porin family protein [Bryobacteraceae bacterium]
MKRFLFSFLLAAPLAFPQLLTWGVKAGVPFTDAFKTAQTGDLGYVSDTRRYTFGGTAEVNLPFGLGVELDLLYRRLNYEAQGTAGGEAVRRSVTANAWDFPLLLKWKAGIRPLQPFFTVGPTFRGLTNLSQAGTFFNSDRGDDPIELERKGNTGLTVGIGARLGNQIALSPEVRYTRWGWDNFRDPFSLLRSNRDQVEFLVGVTF